MEGKKRFSSSTLWRLLLFVLVLLLIAGGTSLFWGQRSDESNAAIVRFDRLLKQNRIKEARSVYYEELFGDVVLQAEAEEKAVDALEAVGIDFAAGRFDYEYALNAIRAFEQSGIFLPSQKIEASYQKITSINEANLSMDAALTAYDEGEYLKAIESYDEVPVGHRLYASAQEGKRRSLEQYRNQVILDAERLLSEGHHIASVHVLETALAVMPQDASLIDAYGEALVQSDDRYRQHIIDLARVQSDKSDVVFALQILEAAIEYLQEVNRESDSLAPDHSLKQANLAQDIRIFRAEASRMRADVVQASVDLIDEALSRGDYQTAVSRLDEATLFMPDSTILANKELELRAQISYELDEFMAAKPYLLELNSSLELLADWRANFGSGIVELYPTPLSYPNARFELWNLPPAVNRFEADLVLEYNEDSLAALGLDADDLKIEVELGSADRLETLQLGQETKIQSVSIAIDRQAIFQMQASVTVDDSTIDADVLEAAGLVRIFVTGGRFYNDETLNVLSDYRDFDQLRKEKEDELAIARWRELHSLSFVQGDLEEGSSDDASPSDPTNETEAGASESDLTEDRDEPLEPETVELAPYLVDKGRDMSGSNYRNVYLYTNDTARISRWTTRRAYSRIRGTIAWQDSSSLSMVEEDALFHDTATLELDSLNLDQTLSVIIYADERPVKRLVLDADTDKSSFILDLPFEAEAIEIHVESVRERDAAFVFLLDLEVSP